MSPELRDEINAEMALLVRELEESREQLESASQETASKIEAMASSALLHSFYNGVENLFKRIATRLDGRLPSGAAWHTELLISMSQPTANRPAVITETLSNRLQTYLGFRHFFRHAYSHTYRWERIAPLLAELPAVFEQLKAELAVFLKNYER